MLEALWKWTLLAACYRALWAGGAALFHKSARKYPILSTLWPWLMAAWFWRLANGWDHPDYWLIFLLINMPVATAAFVGFYAASAPILLAYVVVCDVRHYIHQFPEHPAILAALTVSVWFAWQIRLTPETYADAPPQI